MELEKRLLHFFDTSKENARRYRDQPGNRRNEVTNHTKQQ